MEFLNNLLTNLEPEVQDAEEGEYKLIHSNANLTNKNRNLLSVCSAYTVHEPWIHRCSRYFSRCISW